MTIEFLNAPGAPKSSGGYAQAALVESATKFLFISGQIPESPDGHVPATFREQCLLVWQNIEAQLHAAGMSFDNLVKVTTFLPDRKYRTENGAIRREVLGSRTPALTVIIAGIYDEAWLLEIEAIAAA